MSESGFNCSNGIHNSVQYSASHADTIWNKNSNDLMFMKDVSRQLQARRLIPRKNESLNSERLRGRKQSFILVRPTVLATVPGFLGCSQDL